MAALNRTLSEAVESGSKVSLYINCGYVRDVLIQERYQQWQQNNWETEQGRPVAEADLWKKLLALLNIMDVQPVQKSVWEQNYEIAKNSCKLQSSMQALQKKTNTKGREDYGLLVQNYNRN